MLRENGFINLNSIFGIENNQKIYLLSTLLDYLEENRKDIIIDKEDAEECLICHFNYEGETYYFKVDNRSEVYNELIVSEIARDLNIPVINYDLAKVGSIEGLISKNYKNKNSKYLLGEEILSNIPKDKRTSNTLENIWFELEIRYKDQKTVSRIMQNVVDMFILDILTGQVDRTEMNWEIEEKENGEVSLVPLFDNIRLLMKNPEDTWLSLVVDDSVLGYLGENILQFLKVSSSEFVERFKNSVNVISEDNIKNILKRIEERINAKVPEDLKEEYIEGFKKYYNYINYIIDNYEVNRKHY